MWVTNQSRRPARDSDNLWPPPPAPVLHPSQVSSRLDDSSMRLLRYWMLLSASLGFLSLHAGAALTNAGFEDAHPAAGWEVTTYGAQPRLEVDSGAVHEGKQSLRISAGEPSDTALAQEVSLDPNRWFRFSAWVRTEK